MRIKLEARGLWGAVDPSDAYFQVNRMALNAICNAVSAEMITVLATKDSAREAWESIKTMRISDDRIRKASTQKVRREYEVLDFRDGEGVEDFAMQLMGMVNQLAVLGDPELDDKVILKFLRISRPRFKQLVISIETLLDVSTLTVEKVTGQLRSAEEDGVAPPAADGKLYLTEQEWAEWNKKDIDPGSNSDDSHTEAMAVAAVVIEPADQARKVIATGIASWGIEPGTAAASSPRRIKKNRRSRPKRRSQRFSMPRLNLRFRWQRV
jgi:hypothetical protein